MHEYKGAGVLYAALALAKVKPEEGDPLCYEKRLTEVYSQFVGYGDTCVDVGVHKGDHLMALRRLALAHQVHGFEPCPSFAEGLYVNRLALTSPGKTGKVDFVEDLSRPGYSGLKPIRPTHGRVHKVHAVTLDDWLRKRSMRGVPIRFIKIDTEGHDVDVLEGAAWTIATDQPIIACEWFKEGYTAHGRKAADLYDWAHEMGYSVGDLWGNLCEDRDEFLSAVDVSFWDWMLWPRWAVVAGLPGLLK